MIDLLQLAKHAGPLTFQLIQKNGFNSKVVSGYNWATNGVDQAIQRAILLPLFDIGKNKGRAASLLFNDLTETLLLKDRQPDGNGVEESSTVIMDSVHLAAGRVCSCFLPKTDLLTAAIENSLRELVNDPSDTRALIYCLTCNLLGDKSAAPHLNITPTSSG